MANNNQIKNPDILLPIKINFDQRTNGDMLEIINNPILKSSGGREFKDVIEFHVYDDINTLLYSNHYSTDFKLIDADTVSMNRIQLNAIEDFKKSGIVAGSYNIVYRFVRRLFGKYENEADDNTTNSIIKSNNFTPDILREYFYIDEISPSRYEIRVLLKSPRSKELITSFVSDDFYNGQSDKFPVYLDGFKIELIGNLGFNNEINIINWIRDDITYGEEKPCIIFKLREELKSELDIQQILFLEYKIAEDYRTTIELIPQDSSPDVVTILRPANKDIKIDNKSKPTSDYKNWNSLTTSNINVKNGIYNSVFSSSNSGVDLNVDYRKFSNFIFFGSALHRINNFKYKLELIEQYDGLIHTLETPASTDITGSYNYTSSIIDVYNKKYHIMGTFDAFEKYMYYESASYESSSYGEFFSNTSPKSNAEKPYSLYSITSSQFEDWYSQTTTSASWFDNENIYALKRSIPEFIVNDQTNSDYVKFVGIMGHYYDNIWVYITNFLWYDKQDESIHSGVAKDLLPTIVKSLGFEVPNDITTEDLWSYAIGTNSSGEQGRNDGVVGETYYTGSGMQGVTGKEVSLETWKRILNNLPYIYKSNGTTAGIRSLLNCIGIPSDLLNIETFGATSEIDNFIYDIKQEIISLGYTNVSDKYTYAYNRLQDYLESKADKKYIDYNSIYNGYITDLVLERILNQVSSNSLLKKFYQLNFTGQERIDIPFLPLSSLPRTVEFSFKIDNGNTDNYSLFSSQDRNMVVSTEYNNDSNNPTFGSLKIYFVTGAYVPEVAIIIENVPMYDGDWWSCMISKTYDPITANELMQVFLKKQVGGSILYQYSGSDSFSTASVFMQAWNYISSSRCLSATSSFLLNSNYAPTFHPLIGSIREFRYWRCTLTEESFNQHVLNPISYVGNSLNDAYENLGFRLPMGTDLKSYNHSMTTSISSSHPNQDKIQFGDGTPLVANFVNFPDNNNYSAYQYNVYSVEPITPTFRSVSSDSSIKISQIPSNKTLSRFRRANSDNDEFNKNNRVSITFSPSKNVIDRDIQEQFGSFSITDYLANPQDQFNSTYKDLQILNDAYFKKYPDNYKLFEYMRLSEFFNKGIFNIIKKMEPAKSVILSGLTIESDMLHRNKVNQMHSLPSIEDASVVHDSRVKDIEIDLDDISNISADTVFQNIENQITDDIELQQVTADYVNYDAQNELLILDQNIDSDINVYDSDFKYDIDHITSDPSSYSIYGCKSYTDGFFNGETETRNFIINSVNNPYQAIWSGSGFILLQDDINRINSIYRYEMPNISGSLNSKYQTYELINSASLNVRLYRNAEYTGIIPIGLQYSYFKGCKVTSPSINSPCPDTPDGGPSVEIAESNPNALVSGQPLGGNSDLKII